MKNPKLFYRLSVSMMLLLQLISATGQDQKQNSEFKPQVGQAGKDVIWVPTPDELVKKMLEIAEVTSKDILFDLGSGDGRTVIAAAKLGAHATGIEYNPEMVVLSRKNAELAGVSNMTNFIEADLFQTDLTKATVITMFLLPEINLKLRPKLLDLKPGTRIVSNTFTMGEWQPDYEVTTEQNWESWYTALMWYIPAKVDGTWSMGETELFIKQEFQFIYGSVKTGDKITSITNGRLKGSEITFIANGESYSGIVEANSIIKGKITSGTGTKEWQAVLKDK